MIRSKEDLEYYLKQDALMIALPAAKHEFWCGDMWKYNTLLRTCEYLINCRHDFLSKIRLEYLKFRLFRISRRRRIEIGFNVFGPGLSIAHYNMIFVSKYAKVGKNCRIHQDVTIGTDGFYSQKAPIIGDNVFIGSGAKIIGEVRIADNTVIGANAVVVKDIPEPGTTWAGIPARKVSNHDSSNYIATPGIELDV